MSSRTLSAVLLVAILAPACAPEPIEKRRFDDEGDAGGSGGDGTGAGGGSGPGSGGTMAATTGTGGATTASSASGGGGPGPSSSSSAPACPDPGDEPNDTQATATDLGMIDDCDGSQTSIEGVLAGNDVDWYVFQGTDAFGCVVDPTRAVVADGTFLLCKYVACDSGVGTVTCPAGTTPDTSSEGDGCCGQQGFDVSIDCPGVTDSATVYISLSKPPAFDCVSYTLTFHY